MADEIMKDGLEISNIEIEPLSDEDLDSVAGGVAADSYCCCTTNNGTCTTITPPKQEEI